MFKKSTSIMGLILGFAIPFISLIGQITGYTALWPGFFVVLLYFIAKCEKFTDLKDIVFGGIVGILWSYGVSLFIGLLVPFIGFLAAFTLVLAISVYLLVILGDWQPILFNNYAFLYFLVAGLFPEQKPVEWIAVLLITGVFFAVLVFGGIKLFLKPEKVNDLKAA